MVGVTLPSEQRGPAARAAVGRRAGSASSAAQLAARRSRIRPKRNSSSSTSSSRPPFSAAPSVALRARVSRASTRSTRPRPARRDGGRQGLQRRPLDLVAEQPLGEPGARRLGHRGVGQVAAQRRLGASSSRDREQLVAEAFQLGGRRPGPRRRRAGRSGRRATPGWPPGARAPSAAPARGRPDDVWAPRRALGLREPVELVEERVDGPLRRSSSARDVPMSRSASCTDRPPISPRSWRTACSRCAASCSSPRRRSARPPPRPARAARPDDRLPSARASSRMRAASARRPASCSSYCRLSGAACSWASSARLSPPSIRSVRSA